MEELQDAIEDAQYMNAMHDGVPRPTKGWKWPSPEELQAYLEKTRAISPQMFEAEGLCGGCLGFYMFMKFCSEQNHSTRVMVEFIEDVASFRAKSSSGSLLVVAEDIASSYLVPGSGMGARPGSGSRGNKAGRQRTPNLTRYTPSHAGARRSHRQSSLPRNRENLAPTPSTSPYETEPLVTRHWSEYIKLDDDDSMLTAESAVIESPSRCHIKFHCKVQDICKSENRESQRGSGSRVCPTPLRDSSAYVRNAIHFEGTPLDEALLCLKGNRRNEELDPSNSKSRIRMDLFDEIENMVFNYVVETRFSSFQESPYWFKLFQHLHMTERTVAEDDFSLFRVLGRGGFGLVNACKRCTTGKLYAMKMLNKKRIKMKKAEALCLNERKILAEIQSPFVVCLKYAFATATDLYLILDLMTGGDLGFHLSRKGRFSEKETKYYAARTLLGIAALHEKNIAYRDLKPENILMDEEGYTKISDLGLACKVGRSGLSGTCGTRGYWAPEMLRRDAQDKRERYSVSVDWFSFGCCVYEFMYGISPFRTDKARKWGDFPKLEKADRDRSIDLAIQEMEPDFDDYVFDETAKDLIRLLLNKDGRTRLGANGYSEIIVHPWFAGIDWDDISRSKPPMKPARDINMATQSEIGAFNDEKQSKKILLSDEDHKIYEDWEFTSKKSFEEEVVEFLMHEEKLGPLVLTPAPYGCCSVS